MRAAFEPPMESSMNAFETLLPIFFALGRIFLIACTVIWLASWLFQRWLNPKKGAQQIHDDAKRLYSEDHEWAEIEARTFRAADHQYYDRTEAELSALGFRKLGDIE